MKSKDPAGLTGGAGHAAQLARGEAPERGNFSEPASPFLVTLRPTVAMALTSMSPFARTRNCVDLEPPMVGEGREPSLPRYCANNRLLLSTLWRATISKLLLLLTLPRSRGRRAHSTARKPMEKGKSAYFTLTEPLETRWVNPEGATFPDGTWCHSQNGEDYYCRSGLCLTPNSTIAKFQQIP